MTAETFEWNGGLVYERNVGSTNEMMVSSMNILLKVLTQTKTIKIGRGRNIEYRDVLKYGDSAEETIKIIKNTIEYYKNEQSI